ncbi:NAD-dependent epimerase/dehydratase family protein [uncultured Marinobacter sp.]|uniref:NAD-dependent epimerase/dehydratase family protein n=1 Tax=uncultured Marinobacter sp. TaxID=187379 RepID=UPI0030DD26F6
MTILISGATGFIGRYLCARLTADQHPVLALMRRPEQLPVLRKKVDALGGQGNLVEALAGDLDQPPELLFRGLPEVDAIVHLGARFGWQLDQEEARATNVTGSLAIAELARHLGRRLVFVSGFMLENHAHLRALGIDLEQPEKTGWDQVYRRAGTYEASKLEAAFRVRAMVEQGLDLVEVQPATVAGNSLSGELDPAQPLYQLIDNLAQGRLAMIPGTADHWLPLVAVDHLAALIARATLVENPPARLLALDPDTPPLLPLLAQVAQVLGKRPPKRYLPIPVLSFLLRMPGLSRLMNTYPEALHFIQTTRFDTTATDAFSKAEGLVAPDMNRVIQANAEFYRKKC